VSFTLKVRLWYIFIYVTAHMFIRPMCVFRKSELPAGHFSRSGSGSGGSRKMTGSSGIGIGTGYPVKHYRKHYRFSENTHWPNKHMGRNIYTLSWVEGKVPVRTVLTFFQFRPGLASTLRSKKDSRAKMKDFNINKKEHNIFYTYMANF
jgi:hypothetical protein